MIRSSTPIYLVHVCLEAGAVRLDVEAGDQGDGGAGDDQGERDCDQTELSNHVEQRQPHDQQPAGVGPEVAE